MKFSPVVLVVLFSLTGTTARGVPIPGFGDPLAGLTPAQQSAFSSGRTEFNSAEEVDEGLGPVFNGRSCAECHNVPAAGGGSALVETRFGRTTNGQFDPMAEFGGSLIQTFAVGPADGSTHQYLAETVPAAATIRAGRRTTPLFGLGLVDAVPDIEFIVLAQLETLAHDGTAGRVHYVTNLSTNTQAVGKFGWKDQVPTLFQFSGDAYLNEMGITNPQFPDENCPNGDCSELAYNPMPGINDTGSGVQAFADFMTMLAPPPRGPITGDAIAGEFLFAAIGCGSCHTSTLITGANPTAALDRKVIHPYSDFLLHDMGPLGDGIVQGHAGGHDMRTAPLWGLRMVTRYLHDGRATTLEQAVIAHDGQARAARERFKRLEPADRARVIAFLKSL